MSEEKPSPDPKIKVKKKKVPVSVEGEKELGGYAEQGLKEPTRFGDWEVNGRCSDF